VDRARQHTIWRHLEEADLEPSLLEVLVFSGVEAPPPDRKP